MYRNKLIISVFKFLSAILLLSVITATSAYAYQNKYIGIDAKSKTKFSMVDESGGFPGTDPCKGGFGNLEVVGEVPGDISLADDIVARSIISKGKKYATLACPKFQIGSSELRVRLFKDKYLGRYEGSEVYARWVQIYSMGRAEASNGDPTVYENAAFERYKKEQATLERTKAGIDALDIVVTSTHKLDNNSSFPRFSPDGSKILYTKSVHSSQGSAGYQVQIIRDIETRNIVKTFGKDIISRNASWSPDSKKFAYYAGSSSAPGTKPNLHIFDSTSGKTIRLDISQVGYGDFIVWPVEQEIHILSHYYKNGASLNMDTLEETKLHSDVSSRYLSEETGYGWWSDTTRHKYCYIYRKDVERGPSALIVANRDNSYGRVLLKGVYAQNPYVISPDLTSVVYDKGNDLYIAYLGKRAKSDRNFKIQLLDTTLAKELKNALENNKTIVAAVFAPRINPLNNKVVGPDKGVYKGDIKFLASDDASFIVETTFENEQFGIGDIIAEIHSTDFSIGGLGAFALDTWAVLEK